MGNAAAPPAEAELELDSVAELLQARHLELVSRPAGSDNKTYLIAKIREKQVAGGRLD